MKIIFIVLLLAFGLANRSIRQASIISLDNFELSMLHHQDTLQLQLENIHSKEIFELKINCETLRKDQDLTLYFDSALEIFQHFSKNLDLLSISKLGWITFTVPALNNGRNSSKKTIYLNSKSISEKKEKVSMTIGDFDLMMYMEAEQLVLKMQNTISLNSFKLKLTPTMINQDRRLSTFEKPVQLLKHLTAYSKDVFISEEGIIQFSVRVGDNQRNIQITTTKIEMRLKDLNRKLIGISQKNQKQIKEIKEQLKLISERFGSQLKLQEDQNKIKFQIDSNDWHYYLFDKQVNRLKKREGNGAFQTVFGKQLNPNSTFTFKVKQVNVVNNAIMYGVGSNRIRGKDGGQDQTGDCAVYYSYGSGRLYPGGTQLSTGGLQNGQVIEITIDTGKFVVTWKKNGSVLATSPIPEKIRNEPLFPVIMMYRVGDEIEFV